MVVFTEEPRWDWPESAGPRPAANPPAWLRRARARAPESLAESLPRRKVTWREGTKGKLSAKFAWVRIWPGQGGHEAGVRVPSRSGC